MRVVVDLRTGEELRLEGDGPLVARRADRDPPPLAVSREGHADRRDDLARRRRDARGALLPALPARPPGLDRRRARGHRRPPTAPCSSTARRARTARASWSRWRWPRSAWSARRSSPTTSAPASGSPRSWPSCARRRPTAPTSSPTPTNRANRRPRSSSACSRCSIEEHGGPLGWLAEQGFDPEPLRRRLTGG